MKAMEERRAQRTESKHSARERTGLIINLTFKTAAKKFKRGKPKIKAENDDLWQEVEKHLAAIVTLNAPKHHPRGKSWCRRDQK